MRILVAARDDTLADFLRNAGHETKTLYVNDMAVHLAREFRADTVVYQTAVNSTVPHDDAILALQAAGFRVVLCADPGDSLIPYAAALGIADILTFPVTPAGVLHRVQNPAAAGEAAELVRRQGLRPVNIKQDQDIDSKPGIFGFAGKMFAKNVLSQADCPTEMPVETTVETPSEVMKSPVKLVTLPVRVNLEEKTVIDDGISNAINRETNIPSLNVPSDVNRKTNANDHNPSAEKYLYLVTDIKKNKPKTRKICIISPCSTGATFISVNFAYVLSLKYNVAVLGNDCKIYHLNNHEKIKFVDSLTDTDEFIIMDNLNINEADVVVFVYDLDLQHIGKIKELDMVVNCRKIRVLNKNMPLPISIKKLLGFEPDVVVPMINNYRQILLGRPAAMDIPDVMRGMNVICKILEVEHDQNRMSEPAVFS